MSIGRLRNTAGISIVAFVVAVAASLVYYQFLYLPEAEKKPTAPPEVLNPPESITVRIIEGSANPSQEDNYIPKEVRGSLSLNNKIVWQNDDVTYHSVTTDNNFIDRINGKFDSIDTIGLIAPGDTYEFTFTEVGEYPYHCEPHPWMTGKIEIAEYFG